ncbi:MAG: N-acetylmuramoyl-L-alanine amidase, partial [Peptostreptococcaceae bacterium]
GVKFNKEFTVLRDTRMPACLVEIDFISNKDAEKDLKVSGNIKAVAAAIKDNLIDLFGLKELDNDILYKVCVGAYRDKNNALNQAKLARDKGFKDAYII